MDHLTPFHYFLGGAAFGLVGMSTIIVLLWRASVEARKRPAVAKPRLDGGTVEQRLASRVESLERRIESLEFRLEDMAESRPGAPVNHVQ